MIEDTHGNTYEVDTFTRPSMKSMIKQSGGEGNYYRDLRRVAVCIGENIDEKLRNHGPGLGNDPIV